MSNRVLCKFVWMLCIVGLVAAAGCSEKSKEKMRSDKAISKVEALGGSATREPNSPDGPVRFIDLSEKKVDDNQLAELVETKLLGGLHTLDLSKTQVTGAGLAHLNSLGELQNLDLGNTAINDPDLEPLTNLPQLKSLGLDSTQITDDGLKFVLALSNLETLDLSHTAIDDAGLEQLKGLKHLTKLQVSETKVTGAGVEALKKELPNCDISVQAE